jgi:hypothetical protein
MTVKGTKVCKPKLKKASTKGPRTGTISLCTVVYCDPTLGRPLVHLAIFSNPNKLISIPCLIKAIDNKVNWRGDQLSYGQYLVTRRQKLVAT